MTIDAWPSEITHGIQTFDLVGGESSGGAFGEMPPALAASASGPHWVARVDRLPIRNPVEVSAARGLQARLAGGARPVMIPCCETFNPGGTITITADAGQGATSIGLTGAVLPLQGGEPFSATHAADDIDKRLYRVVEPLGGGLYRITPPLRGPLTSGDVMDFATPACPMHSVEGFDLPLDLGRFSAISGTLEEWFDPAPVLLLRALSLSPAVVASGAPEDTFVGNILFATTGSTLTLTDDAGGRFKLVLEGATWKVYAGATATDFSVDASHAITVRETLAGYANSPRDNVLTIDVQVVGYRYFRLALTKGVRDNFTAITAIELAETVDGPDVSSEATISVGGSGSESVAFGAAFDGNAATQWIRNISSGIYYVDFDFGASPSGWKLIAEARITGSYDIATRSPGDSELFHADDTIDYVSQGTGTYGDSWVKSGVRTSPEAAPPEGYYRVWRLFMQTNNGGNLIVFGEMAMLDPDSADIMPTGHTDDSDGRVIYASTIGGGNAPYYGYDGSGYSGYATDLDHVTDQYFGMVFPEPVKIGVIQVTQMVAGSGIADPAGRGPRDVSRQASHTQRTGEWDTFASTTWSGWGVGISKSI